MSGLDELTREELIALVLRLHETVQAQEKQIAELEIELARLRGGGSSAPLNVKPSVHKKQKGPRKKRKHSFARQARVPTEVVCHCLLYTSRCV